MPQDKRRSISYRSFLTCDDPKGVVECGAIRKSKISSMKKEQHSRFEGEKKQENSNPTLSIIREEKKEMGIRGITRELETPSSFQLLEVSKGANKLNHVINSWSNEKREPKDVAKDLWKGAIDLQESLAMLRKLQEASSCMPGLSRKHKQKLEREEFDGIESGLMGSNRVGCLKDEKRQMGFQRPRVSLDGCSRKSFDELKNVVRDSLFRQNVITNPIFEENFDHRKQGSPDMPSTSSSQLSMVHSTSFAPSDSSISSSFSQRNKGKCSSLIVKLMGLDSLPSSPRKHKGEKITNLTKPLYDVDSPKARKPQFSAHELGMKQRTVDEILETLNFKGLLRSKSVNEMMLNSPHSEVFPSKNKWVDERPPIVILKPSDFSSLDLEEPVMPTFRGHATIKAPINPKCRESPHKTINSEAEIFSEKFREVEAGAYCEEKGKPLKLQKVGGKLHEKPQKKQPAGKKAGEVEKASPTRSKGEEVKATRCNEELRSRDQAKLTISKMKKRKGGMIISKNQTSGRRNTTSTAILDDRRQEKSKSSSQLEKNRQPVFIDKNQRSKGGSKQREATDIEEIDSTRENETVLPRVGSMIVDNFHAVEQDKPSQIQISDYDIDNQSSASETREVVAYLHDDKKISVYNVATLDSNEDDNQSSLSDITSASTTEHWNLSHLDENQSPLHEVTLVTTHENGVPIHLPTVKEGTLDHPENYQPSFSEITSRKCLSPRTKLKALLLSSPSFMSRAEELFNLQVNPYLVNDVNDSDLSNPRILLDCAIEVMELMTLQFSEVYLPVTRIPMPKPRNSVSLDWLLEEICNSIEELICCYRPASESFSFDNFYSLLDRDLRFKSGTWEIGWRKVFSKDEVEQVVGEVDNLVLGKLIEEVISDFML